jgi:hypothetical protein
MKVTSLTYHVMEDSMAQRAALYGNGTECRRIGADKQTNSYT